jgi:hypothetical protein
MRLRLFACVAMATIVVGASASASRRALAQGERPGQGQQSEQGKERSSEYALDIDRTLKSYDERMGRNLDRCRQDLDQMKKELHELIDLRLEMAMTLAELRARGPMPGTGIGGPGGAEASRREAREGSEGRGEANAGLAQELQQIHNQIRAEVEQQQNQVAQLVGQLRRMKERGQQRTVGDQSGSGRRPQSDKDSQGRPQEKTKG